METKVLSMPEMDKISTTAVFNALLNCCCRELDDWCLYKGIPKHDKLLGNYMKKIEKDYFIRLNLRNIDQEIYFPLAYYSRVGIHSISAPVFARNKKQNTIQELSPEEMVVLISDSLTINDSDIDPNNILKLLTNSQENLMNYILFNEHSQTIHSPFLNFIQAEQSLLLGHSVHPIGKSRIGFTEEDQLLFSPELHGSFQLYYFLVSPEYVTAKNTTSIPITEEIKQQIIHDCPNDVSILLDKYPHWKIVPLHPWEAKYVNNQPLFQEMIKDGVLFDLGMLGEAFQATSSVRTVYNPNSPWMFKFSLHVKITNSFRINYEHELYRGYDAARLLNTEFGEDIRHEYPQVSYIADQGFILVHYKGQTIDSFSTSIRPNTFHGEKAQENIGMVASLTQAGFNGSKSRMHEVLDTAAEKSGKTKLDTASEWFRKYLSVTVEPLFGIFNRYGLGCEFHQQNMLLQLDDQYYPEQSYFRDNQGYFVRENKVLEIQKYVPDYGQNSRSFLTDDKMCGFWGYYLIQNQVLGVIAAIGQTGYIDELELIAQLHQTLDALRPSDETGLIDYLLDGRKLRVKCNMLTGLHNMDEASAPRARPAIYKEVFNPLQKSFFSERLIQPKGNEAVYKRFFPKTEVEISIRPFNMDTDLDLVHDWFHREHALKIWQMNWPIEVLEDYYLTLLPGEASHSYIGCANGVPTFNIEVYWATRDRLGDYYEVLPSDYGTHQFIAPVDPKLKFASQSTQSMVDFVFADPHVGKMVGEGSVDSLASIMNKAHVGFKIEKVIELPDKKANLNFCYLEWYWAKFPEAKAIYEQLISKK